MNLTFGYKEYSDKEWIYTLKNGISMTQDEWTSQVKKHVEDNNNQKILDRLTQEVGNNIQIESDTPIDFVLQRYAAIYCTNIESKERIEKVKVHTESRKG